MSEFLDSLDLPKPPQETVGIAEVFDTMYSELAEQERGRSAAAALEEHVKEIRRSIAFEKQNTLNKVAGFILEAASESSLSPRELLVACLDFRSFDSPSALEASQKKQELLGVFDALKVDEPIISRTAKGERVDGIVASEPTIHIGNKTYTNDGIEYPNLDASIELDIRVEGGQLRPTSISRSNLHHTIVGKYPIQSYIDKIKFYWRRGGVTLLLLIMIYN